MKDLINMNRHSNQEIISLFHQSEDADERGDNLENWEVTRMNSTEIEIGLKFKDPLQVSIGWTRDELLVDVNLTDYATFNDVKLRRFILIGKIPVQ